MTPRRPPRSAPEGVTPDSTPELTGRRERLGTALQEMAAELVEMRRRAGALELENRELRRRIAELLEGPSRH